MWLFTHCTRYKCVNVCQSVLVCVWAEGPGSVCCIVSWMKMLTGLKIITQEGCLCETEVREAGAHMDHTGVCEASCLGSQLCVWAKESTAFRTTRTHIHTHIATALATWVFFAPQLQQLPLRIQRNRKIDVFFFFLKKQNPLFPLIGHNRTMCSN